MSKFNKYILLFFLFLAGNILAAQENAWPLFEKAAFKEQYIEEQFGVATLLDYNDYAKSLDGKTIKLTGHYIPVMDESIIIISKYPYANCFFCGGAGLESVVEIRLKNKKKINYELDQKLTFIGKLKLNHTDWELVSFIVEDAIPSK